MNSFKRLVASLCITFALTGCATYHATLYPLNAQAQADGILHATIHQTGIGRGTITCNLPTGEILKGQYRNLNNGSLSYGFAGAQAGGVGAFGSGFGQTVPGSEPIEAILVGDKGTTLDCQAYYNPWSGGGAGVCRTTAGAEFRLMF